MKPTERKLMLFAKAQSEPMLDDVIKRILSDMDNYGPDAPEYDALLGHLERVYAMKQTQSAKRVSPDTIALVLGNLFGIIIIVAYEQKNVITSKGLGFIMKSK